LKEKPHGGPVIERIGFLDIETSNLSATFGYIFSYCIKELDGPILERVLTPAEVKSGAFDRGLMIDCNRDMRKFDRLIVFWGKDRRHDIPFLRTRAAYYDLEFPLYKELIVNDLWDICKNKLRLHSNRLQAACDFFDIPAKQHKLEPTQWQKAMAGDKKALAFILEHNREDVISTEALWKKIQKYSRNPDTTI